MKKQTKVIDAITKFLFIGDEMQNLSPCDLVIVLGNDFIVGTIRQISKMYSKKIINNNTKIILSGATGVASAGKDLECNRMYDCAVNMFAMPKELFIKEPYAKNTFENFLYSKQIIRDLGGFDKFNNILCVGKAFLLRRASMYAAKFAFPEHKMEYYGTVDVEGKNIGPDTWWKSEESIKRVMSELERIGRYYNEGYLSL